MITPKFLFIIFCLMFAGIAFAATWTVQPEKYLTYNTKPSNVAPLLKRVPANATLEIPTSWSKLGGLWRKEVSTGGSARYYEELIAPVTALCDAKFVCHEDWGWIVNLSHNSVLTCPAIKITKDQAAFYENALSINGKPVCP